jgi:hypothetical protein
MRGRRAFANLDKLALDLIARAYFHRRSSFGYRLRSTIERGFKRRRREYVEIGGSGRMRLCLDSAITLNDTMAKRRKLGAAAARAAVFGIDDGFIENTVELID